MLYNVSIKMMKNKFFAIKSENELDQKEQLK